MKHWLITILLLLEANSNIVAQQAIIDYPSDIEKTPSLAWEYKTNGPIYSSPILENNIIYFGSLDSNFYAVDLNNGKLLWKYKTDGDIRSNAVIAGNNILVVSGDGCLYSINKNTHQLTWKFKSRGDKKYELYTFADYFQSSPIVNGDTVFYGTGDCYIYAVNITNGQKIWEYKTDGIVHATPLYYKNNIYVGSFDGHLYALESKSGKLVWKFKTIGQRYFPKGEMSGSAIAFAGMIIAGGRDYNLYALSANKGYGVWNRQFPKGWAIAKPVIRDTVLYVGTGDDKALFALDPYDGAQKWSTDVKFNVFGSFAFSKNMIYVPTLMGRIYAININDGSIVWKLNSALYEKNRLNYFTKEDNYREDIEKIVSEKDGVLNMYYNLGAIFSTPLVINHYLIFTSTDGKIYAFKN